MTKSKCIEFLSKLADSHRTQAGCHALASLCAKLDDDHATKEREFALEHMYKYQSLDDAIVQVNRINEENEPF